MNRINTDRILVFEFLLRGAPCSKWWVCCIPLHNSTHEPRAHIWAQRRSPRRVASTNRLYARLAVGLAREEAAGLSDRRTSVSPGGALGTFFLFRVFLPSGSILARVCERVLPNRLPWGGFLVVLADKRPYPCDTLTDPSHESEFARNRHSGSCWEQHGLRLWPTGGTGWWHARTSGNDPLRPLPQRWARSPAASKPTYMVGACRAAPDPQQPAELLQFERRLREPSGHPFAQAGWKARGTRPIARTWTRPALPGR